MRTERTSRDSHPVRFGMLVIASAGLLLGMAAAPALAETFPGAIGKVAFASTRAEVGTSDYEIWVMEPDGSGLLQLTDNLAINDYTPSWSPDGTRIAFARGPVLEEEIWVMAADGTGAQQLTDVAGHDYFPTWSPDGTRIAFTSQRDGGDFEIVVMNADGSGETALTVNDSADYMPSWSPDGTRIAFASDREGGGDDIFVMGADGSDPQRITDAPGDDQLPSWSPDGSKITFTSERDGDRDIYVMASTGGVADNLTSRPTDDGYDWYSRFSPDGTKLVFASDRDGDNEVWVMNADGSSPQQLTSADGWDYYPNWQVLTAPGITGVVVSGSSMVGQTLKASASGVTGAPEPNVTWQWQRAPAATGPWTDLPGASAATLWLTSAHVGLHLRAVATATNGVEPAASRSSAGVAPR